jgi:hypothetical protein
MLVQWFAAISMADGQGMPAGHCVGGGWEFLKPRSETHFISSPNSLRTVCKGKKDLLMGAINRRNWGTKCQHFTHSAAE